MLESIFIFMLTFNLLVGVTQEVVVPVVTEAVELSAEVIDYLDLSTPKE